MPKPGETQQARRHVVGRARLPTRDVAVFAPRTIKQGRDAVIENVEEGHHRFVTLATQRDIVY
jgi:hypothetical protein